MDARLQRRVQRYGWDRAVDPYAEHWLHRLWPATQWVLERAAIAPGEHVLDTAIITALEKRDPRLMKKLDAVAGRILPKKAARKPKPARKTRKG
jgi:hypothetical protein